MIRSILIAACGTALIGLGFAPPRDAGARSAEGIDTPTTAPTTKPVVSILLGNYRGTVVDDDETVPCVTTFREYFGRIVGTYVVREGKERYEGTLDEFKLLSDDRGECRFRWHDKNGDGLVTVHVTPDGASFAGSWGLEVVQDELVWTGTREGSTAPLTGPHGR